MQVNGELHAPATVPRGKNPGTHWVGGWVGLMAGLDTVFKLISNSVSISYEQSHGRQL